MRIMQLGEVLMSTSGKTKRQIAADDEAVPLADLMEHDSLLEHAYEVVEPEKTKENARLNRSHLSKFRAQSW